MFWRERVDMQRMLAQVSGGTALIFYLSTLGDVVLDGVGRWLPISKAVLFVADKETGVLEQLAERGLAEGDHLRLLPDNPLVRAINDSDKILRRESLLHLPELSGMWTMEKHDLEQLDVQLLVGINLKGELVGVLALGPKKSSALRTKRRSHSRRWPTRLRLRSATRDLSLSCRRAATTCAKSRASSLRPRAFRRWRARRRGGT